MIYTIGSEGLKVAVDDVGAQLWSVKTADGHEYLWQGDPAFWTGRAYNLFPVIGRMNGGKYDYRGETYEMPAHGLVRKRPLTLEKRGGDCLSFVLRGDEETEKYYPFPFLYRVTFSVKGNALSVKTEVENTGKDVLPFGVGGHPGFFVPMEEGVTFEDYFVAFENAGEVRQCVMNDDVLFTGERPLYPLQNKRLPLSHALFPVDALVLENTGGVATIASDKGKRRVTMRYPDMKYMGLWHKPATKAPYLCLEPWSMLPARAEGRDDFESKEDMTRLPAGEKYENVWTVEFI